jgi:hypothetical protein
MKKMLTLVLLVYSANIFAVWSNVVKLLDMDTKFYSEIFMKKLVLAVILSIFVINANAACTRADLVGTWVV